ncbi:MAG: A/G-specific adenine glycosylase [Myxococcales bacterium]|nr:A/G-specific adenine glycosylase [Myxococcales bacterium]
MTEGGPSGPPSFFVGRVLHTSTVNRDLQTRRALVEWFRRGHRDMPWRRTREPYAVWVSEIMLQQTRVETVTPYFERWMRRFPTVATLAEAPLDDVLRHWAGLGYYARARNMHAAARDVVTGYEGKFPPTAEGLRALKGVGAYTAGAIASIAYGEAAAIVDGNVVRVLARVDALPGAADEAELKRRVWERAGELVRADGGEAAGDFNQAMMELGAMVCTPRAPGCSKCPLAKLCRARAEDSIAAHPGAKTKKAPRAVDAVAVLAERDGKLLLVRRPPTGLWGGLWEPPMREIAAGETPEAAAQRVAKSCTGLTLSNIQSIDRFDHVLTHRRMRFHVFRARARGRLKLDGYDAARWQARTGSDEVGVAAWTKRLFSKELT